MITSARMTTRIRWISLWLTILAFCAGCQTEKRPRGDIEVSSTARYICFCYAGAESDKPFFPLALVAGEPSRRQAVDFIASRSHLRPTLLETTNETLDQLLMVAQNSLHRAPLARNAAFGDFEVSVRAR